MVCQKSRISKDLFILCVMSLVLFVYTSNGCLAYSEPGNSVDNPILINSLEDLEILVQDLNEGQSYLNKYLKLNNDITIADKKHLNITDTSWESIGNKDKVFDGNFDGNGHSITCNINDFHKNGTNSLFGTISKNGFIKDLNILGHISSSNTADTCVLCHSNYGTIKNCSINVDINSLGSVSSIAIDNYGVIDECFNYGKLSAENKFCSGIVINNNGIIKNCYISALLQNTVKINNSQISGVAMYNNNKIINCLVVSDINNVYSSLYQESESPIFSNENTCSGISFINNGEIDSCSYIGDLCSNIAAGISIRNNGIINYCGISANIKGIIAASVSAFNNENGQINNCYCVSNVYSNYYIGKIVAIDSSKNNFDTCFCETNISKLK